MDNKFKMNFLLLLLSRPFEIGMLLIRVSEVSFITEHKKDKRNTTKHEKNSDRHKNRDFLNIITFILNYVKCINNYHLHLLKRELNGHLENLLFRQI